MRLIGTSLIVLLFLVPGSCSNEESTADRTVHGVIVDIVSGTGFGNVISFSVRENQSNVEIFIDPEVEYEDFPLPHIFAHRAAGDPVIVEVEERAGKLFALTIKDA